MVYAPLIGIRFVPIKNFLRDIRAAEVGLQKRREKGRVHGREFSRGAKLDRSVKVPGLLENVRSQEWI